MRLSVVSNTFFELLTVPQPAMNSIRLHSRAVVWPILATILLSLTGCQSPWSSDWQVADFFSLDKGMPWDDGPKKGTPVRLAGTWTDSVLHQPGKTPQRGFGGRLLFYNKKGNDPILVDGQLVVYAFDESDREPTDNRPTRRYVFPADQVALRMSESELGPSYSFWLPWDEVGNPQTEVSLIARFEPKKGPLIVGEQTRHILPGTLEPGSLSTSKPTSKLPEGVPVTPAATKLSDVQRTGNPVQVANFENQLAGDGSHPAVPMSAQSSVSSPRGMTTTSISLPENFRVKATPANMPVASRLGVGNANHQIAAPAAPSARYAPQPFQAPAGSVPALPGSQMVPNGYRAASVTSRPGPPTVSPMPAAPFAPVPMSTPPVSGLPPQAPNQFGGTAAVSHYPAGAPVAIPQPSFHSGLR